MKADDVNRLEAAVRDANPVPQIDALVDSEESVAVTLRLIEATEKEVPGLLPVQPKVERRERGLTMETVQSVPEREAKRPKPARIAAIAFAAAVFVAAVIGVGALLTRDDAGDVATPITVAPPQITFDDPGRDLFTYETEIRQLIEETYVRAAPLVGVDGLSFVVSHRIVGLDIPGYGIGWMPSDDTTVVIGIDPYFPQLGEVLSERVPVTVANVVYGKARSDAGLYEETFFDTMIGSGLSDRFAVELLGVPPAPWADAFPAERTDELMERAQPLFDTRWDDMDNPNLSTADVFALEQLLNAWFCPEYCGEDIPQWTGYTLGYRLIEAYLAENPDQTAADLVTTPASVFRP